MALDPPFATLTSKSIHQPITSAPNNPLPTRPPTLHRALRRGLVARDDSTLTCGYTNGDAAQPHTCDTSSQCLFNTITAGLDALYFFCASVGATEYIAITTCITYDGAGTNTGPVYATNNDGSTTGVTCGMSYPLCRTTYFPSVPGLTPTGTFTHYDCVSTTQDIDIIVTLSQNPTTRSTSTSETSLTTQPTTQTTTVTVDTTIIAPPPTLTVTPSSTPSAPSSAGLSTGAKAGIGVGAGIGAALIFAGALYLWGRDRKQKQRDKAVPEVSTFK